MSSNTKTQAVFKRINDKGMVRFLTYTCMLIYFASYMTRLNYAAVISEIERAESIPKDMLSFGVTGLFITYGVGQLISGFLGDRIKPKYLVFFGILLSSVMNLILPLYANAVYFAVVWCINGFGQAMIWPPMVKILSGYLSEENYVKSVFTVIIGSTAGTIGVYLLGAVCCNFFTWHVLFYISAVLGIMGALLSLWGTGKSEKYANAHGEEIKEYLGETTDTGRYIKMNARIYTLIVIIMFAIVFQGCLRDGVTTWMPTLITETFNLGTAVSILSGVVLPLFTLVSISAVKLVYPKRLRNEVVVAGIIFGIGTVFALILSLTDILKISHPVVSVVCIAMIVGCMHGVNQMLICILPGQFKKTGKISTISGVLNFATYVGAAISTYGFAVISGKIGWSGTIISWIIIGLLGTIVCFSISKMWEKFEQNKL